MIALSFDATVRFARYRAEQLLAVQASPDWKRIDVNSSDKLKRAFFKRAEAAGKLQDLYEEWRNGILSEVNRLSGEKWASTLREVDDSLLRKVEEEHFHTLWGDETTIEDVAKDTWTEWEALKYKSGLDLRGILRRRALIPFVLFPRHVSARVSNTDLPYIYQNLRQAHDAFVFGVPGAALALMRSVMEMILRDHYAASGSDLDELIRSVANRLPNSANSAALHRLRRLANQILHAKSDGMGPQGIEKRDFELQIVSLLFVVRALIEGAPQSNVQRG